MTDIFDIISEYSYIGIFFLLIAVNAAPLLMPPTWIILSSFYAIDPLLDPLILSIIGATGATIGRFFLKSNLDAIGTFLQLKKFGYIITSFVFAATPLPSNMLFVTYGLLRAKSLGLYVGFWAGRILSYYIMISISTVVLTPFIELFEDRYIGIIIADVLGVGTVVFFTCINWNILLTKRKFKLNKPKLWKF